MTHAFDASAPSNVIELPVRQSLLDAEFSDAGRDPRFPSGWWLAPLMVIVPAAAIVIGILFFNWLVK